MTSAADGMSPLPLAARNDHFELAVELIKAGADPHDQRTRFAALHIGSWVRKPDASDRGDPAPGEAGRLTSLEFVRALVAPGADSPCGNHYYNGPAASGLPGQAAP